MPSVQCQIDNISDLELVAKEWSARSSTQASSSTPQAFASHVSSWAVLRAPFWISSLVSSAMMVRHCTSGRAWQKPCARCTGAAAAIALHQSWLRSSCRFPWQSLVHSQRQSEGEGHPAEMRPQGQMPGLRYVTSAQAAAHTLQTSGREPAGSKWLSHNHMLVCAQRQRLAP